MGDIHNHAWLRDFIHRNEGNSIYTCMYADDGGLVTVGIGNLLPDARSAVAVHARRRFHHHREERLTGPATPSEVEQDWNRVRARGRIRPFSERAAKELAQLRMSREDCLGLLMDRINGFVDAMYQRYAWARDLPEEIQIAIIDARFNPKGVNPFVGAARLWEALRPDGRDLSAAVVAFRQYWEGGGTAYRARHARRVVLFQQGIDRLNGATRTNWALSSPAAAMWSRH